MSIVTEDKIKKKVIWELALPAISEMGDWKAAYRLRAASLNDVVVWSIRVETMVSLPKKIKGIWATGPIRIRPDEEQLPGRIDLCLTLFDEDSCAVIEWGSKRRSRFLIVIAYIKRDDE